MVQVIIHEFVIIFISAASAKQFAAKAKPIVPKIETPTAVNHLFLAKQGLHGKNRFVATGPRIANMYPVTRPVHLEQRPKSVQPITPHVVGDTKCKWVQKQKKEFDKGTKVTKSTSSPKKTETENVNGKEKEANNNVYVREEHCELKAVITEAEIENSNNNCDTSYRQDGDGSVNDSGLGTSLHSVSIVDATDIEIKKDENRSLDCQNNKAFHKKLLSEQQQVAAADNVVLMDVTESGKENAEYDSISENTTEMERKHLKETDLNIEPGSDCAIKGLHDSECDSVACRMSEHGTPADDICESDTVGLIHQLSTRIGAADLSVHGSAELADSVDSGALNESTVKATSHQLANGELQNKFHRGKHTDEVLNTKKEEAKRNKCDSETEVESTSNIKLSNENNQGIVVTTTGNINNNCSISDGKHKSKIVLSEQTSEHMDNAEEQKLKCSKSVKSSSKDSKDCVGVESQRTDSKSESVNMYYSTKKHLAAKASSFDDHLQTYRQQKKSFNPFPVKHVNTNRAKTGVKLGLYKQSTLDEFERNLRKPVWGK